MKSKAMYPVSEIVENIVYVYAGFRADGTPPQTIPAGTGYVVERVSAGLYSVEFDYYTGDYAYADGTTLHAAAYCKHSIGTGLTTLVQIYFNVIYITCVDSTGAHVDPDGDISVRAAILYSVSQLPKKI